VVVQCPSCQSKFRIADEKVTERGVRVRCSTCKEVFQAKKAGGGAEMQLAQPGVTGSTIEIQLFDAQALAQAKATAAARAAGNRGPATIAVTLPGSPGASAPPAPAASAAAPRATSAPTTAPQTPKGPANGSRRPKGDDLFGMSELTGDAAPEPGSPLSKSAPEGRPASTAPAGLDGLELDIPAARPPASQGSGAFGADPDFEPLLDGPAAGAAQPAGPPSEERSGLALDSSPTGTRPPTGPTSRPLHPRRPQPSADAESRRTAGGAFVSTALTALLGSALALVVLFAMAFSEGVGDSVRSALGGGEDLVATRVVSGLYDTAGGQPIFFVRGRVENRSKKARGPVRVVAELVSDSGPEGRGEALAGLEPSAEDVYALRTPAEADKLARALAQNEGTRKIPPGGSLPFFALIHEPPRDPHSHRLHVRLEPVDAWTTPVQAKPAPAPARPAP
jgi:predicted Zn finger-like uncharacterized protein